MLQRCKGRFHMSITLWSQLIWFCALALGSFLVSWIFTDLLHIARTAYVAIFAVVTGAYLFGYLQWNDIDWGTFISQQWLWGLIVATAVGLVVVALLAWLVRWQSLSLLPPPGPQGMRLVSMLLVNGVVNGAAEALLLSVLPVLIVWQAFSPLPWFHQWPGSAFASVIALVASLIVISLHHLGFRELRGHLIIFVILGNAAFTLAYLLTMNPLAAVVAHIMMHIGAEFQRIEVPIHQQKRIPAAES
jgi:hypothetical protein